MLLPIDPQINDTIRFDNEKTNTIRIDSLISKKSVDYHPIDHYLITGKQIKYLNEFKGFAFPYGILCSEFINVYNSEVAINFCLIINGKTVRKETFYNNLISGKDTYLFINCNDIFVDIEKKYIDIK